MRTIEYAYFSLNNMIVTQGKIVEVNYYNEFKFLLKVVKPVEVVTMHNESRGKLI